MSAAALCDFEPRPLRKVGARLHADAEHDKVGLEARPLELDRLRMNRAQVGTEMKANALLFVKLLHEAAYLRAHDVLERHSLVCRQPHIRTRAFGAQQSLAPQQFAKDDITHAEAER